ATAAVITPETPPITNIEMKPTKYRNAVVITGRPVQIVAVHANTPMALGMVMMNEAPEKKASDMNGIPVANMWCSQTPNPRIMVVIVPITTGTYPTSGRRQKNGSASETSPIAGSTTT